MDLALQDKVAMITGGSHGLGKQAADSLAREGCKVAICARGQENLDATVAEFKAKGYEVLAVQADVMKQADLKNFHDQTIKTLGEADILVNNAGGRKGVADFQETGVETFREGMEFNLMSPVELIALVLPHMREQRWGRIISIISDAGRVGEPRLVAYSMAKAGVVGFSKALAKEVGRYCITVNCISPATTATEATQAWLQAQGERIMRQYPLAKGLNRLGQPADIANAVAFLASQRAEWITGQVLSVNGGYSMAD